ncbi:MAG: hypothetical protein ACRD8O_24685, partial [Bryobacteraceae bacterium]
LWTDVEDTLTPGLRRGVVSFAGSEQPGTSTLRRSAALLKYWAAVIPGMRSQRRLKGAVPALQLSAPGTHGASAVLVANAGASVLRGELRPMDPSAKRPLIIPSVEAPPGESLWLPVNVALAAGGLCDDCAVFAPQDRIVYATAELHSIEFENGILACEFVAPVAGSVVIQLSRKPSGPLLAGGRPAEFEWDAERSAVRLPIPAGKAPLYRVRIGLAIEPPDQSAFFSNTARLVIGQSNVVSTAYSSEALAGRSRLLAPPGFRVTRVPKGPLEIDYEVMPPEDALHGEFVALALEADGVRLGRTRLQLFRPASLRIREALAVHYGAQGELAPEHSLVTADPAGGRNLSVVIRNNSSAIRNFVLESSGEGLTFLPAKTEVSVAAQAEREVSVRVMAGEGTTGASRVRLQLSGTSTVEQDLTVIWVRRGGTAVHSADVDGDGASDWLIESRQVRAVFSGGDGRWMEFVWKDSGTNLLGEAGAIPLGGSVSAQPIKDGVTFIAGKMRRTVRLNGPTGALEIEQDAPLDGIRPETRDGVSLTMERSGPGRVVFSLRRQQE